MRGGRDRRGRARLRGQWRFGRCWAAQRGPKLVCPKIRLLAQLPDGIRKYSPSHLPTCSESKPRMEVPTPSHPVTGVCPRKSTHKAIVHLPHLQVCVQEGADGCAHVRPVAVQPPRHHLERRGAGKVEGEEREREQDTWLTASYEERHGTEPPQPRKLKAQGQVLPHVPVW